MSSEKRKRQIHFRGKTKCSFSSFKIASLEDKKRNDLKFGVPYIGINALKKILIGFEKNRTESVSQLRSSATSSRPLNQVNILDFVHPWDLKGNLCCCHQKETIADFLVIDNYYLR